MARMKRKTNSRERLKKAQVSLYVEKEQLAALRKLSAATGAPMQWYIRQGIDLILAQHAKGGRT